MITNNEQHNSAQPPSNDSLQYSVNPRTGRQEYVFANLELVYPSGDAECGYEFCFEELRAMKRGLIDPTGRVVKQKKQKVVKETPAVERPVTPPKRAVSPKNTKAHSAKKLDIFQDTETTKVPAKMPVFADEAQPLPAPAKLQIFADSEQRPEVETSQVPVKIPILDENGEAPSAQDAASKAARRAKKEEKANRTRKLAIMEVKAEPQTGE